MIKRVTEELVSSNLLEMMKMESEPFVRLVEKETVWNCKDVQHQVMERDE